MGVSATAERGSDRDQTGSLRRERYGGGVMRSRPPQPPSHPSATRPSPWSSSCGRPRQGPPVALGARRRPATLLAPTLLTPTLLTPTLLVATLLGLGVFAPAAWASAPTTPIGGCPMPPNTLVINEFQVGIGAHPRWVELLNPGTAAISLKGVVLRVNASGIAGKSGDTLEFSLEPKVSSIPGGEVLLLGHLPDSGTGSPYFGLTMVNLGATFVLPACVVKVELIGPLGLIDSYSFDLCGGTNQPTDTVWQQVNSLDPAHADLCQSDQISNWCMTTAKASPAQPSPGKVNQPCDLDGDGYTATTGDCDDGDKSVNPLATEQCNGVDDDCNGQTDDSVTAPIGTCLSDGVCTGPLPNGKPVAQCDGKNGYVCSYPAGYESVNETLCDGYDNDCDGQTDEGLLNACGSCGADPTEICNGKDDDCDGETDESPNMDAVVCGGEGVCVLATPVCNGVDGPACQLPPSYEVTETRCDGVDNDCDGATDEELGLGQSCVVGRGECQAAGVLKCGPSGATLCAADVGQPRAEVCGDNLDNDCNGQTDEGFDVGSQCTVGLGSCRVIGKMVCVSTGGTASTCDATPAKPLSFERCDNGIDDDCDGLTDEAGCKEAAAPGWSCGAGRAAPQRSLPWSLAAPFYGLVALLLRTRRRRADRS